jgi:flavin reductase (DIM6/NTAB) family NADH-FMN oxidoreductase RutF/rubredoxin
MQITAEPATIAVSISHDNYTNQCITNTGRFAMTVLAETSEPSIIGTFGFQSGKNTNKFDTANYEVKGNMPILLDGCAYFTFEVINKMETDTHTVYLGKVIDADLLEQQNPMTYAYYHKVVKGKSPKNAPTYIAVESKEIPKQEKYVCSICGYEYAGSIPFEELPEDYICPLCRQPKSVFKKQ